jgi:hypothetical protein
MDEKNYQDAQKVVVTDIRMPFWSMVMFMVKLVLASIPALVIFSMIISLVMAVITMLFGAMWGFHGMFHQGGPSF